MFPVRYMCLGSVCSCAYTWHYDSAYRSERVLAVQTCIFVDFVCFQNISCAFTRHSGIHVLAELVCLLAELRYILVRIVFSKDMPQTCYGCVCVCVFTRHSDLHVLAELKVYYRQLRVDIYVAELLL